MIEGLHPNAIAIIEGLQPIKLDFKTDPLYILNELWNRDKHRLLNFASVRFLAFKESYIYPSGRYSESPTLDAVAVVEDGAEIGRFRPPSDITPEVKVYPQIDYSGLIFQDAGPATGHQVLEILPQLVQFTESIVNNLIMLP
jgi:hypothetical protein